MAECQHEWQVEHSTSFRTPEDNFAYVACALCGKELQLEAVPMMLNDLQQLLGVLRCMLRLCRSVIAEYRSEQADAVAAAAALRVALRRYGAHTAECRAPGAECTCGLDAFVSSVAQERTQ